MAEMKNYLIAGLVGFVGGGYLYNEYIKKNHPNFPALQNQMNQMYRENNLLRGELGKAIQQLKYPDWAERQRKFSSMRFDSNDTIPDRSINTPSPYGMFGMVGVNPKPAMLAVGAPSPEIANRQRRFSQMPFSQEEHKTARERKYGFAADTKVPKSDAQMMFNMK